MGICKTVKRKIRVDRYYDVTCCWCGRSLSSDFECGMAPSLPLARKWALEKGFTVQNGLTVCPFCKGETVQPYGRVTFSGPVHSVDAYELLRNLKPGASDEIS